MKSKPFFFSRILLAFSLCARIAWAGGVTIADGFETYFGGGLDKNDNGFNNAPNGWGNPWFGPVPPNCRVVGQEGNILPHSGNLMVRGAPIAETDFDQNWYNLQYRLNCGHPLPGDLQLDWWFYDPDGASGANFRDYAALGFYDQVPADTDYPGDGSLNLSTQIQRLSLGATSGAGVDTTKYQARIVGAVDGHNSAGWFNLPVTRSDGWHHGRIWIGPPLGNNTNDVRFYVDDMVTPALQHNSVLAYGYNVIELNAKFGIHTTYYDDVTFTANNDADGDGVLDGCDLCAETPLNTPVDAAGCTMIPGDFNHDGFVDEIDLGMFTACFTAPPPAPAVLYDPQNPPVGCTLEPDGQGFLPSDFDRDYILGPNDFAVFQRCYSGAVGGDLHCAD